MHKINGWIFFRDFMKFRCYWISWFDFPIYKNNSCKSLIVYFVTSFFSPWLFFLTNLFVGTKYPWRAHSKSAFLPSKSKEKKIHKIMMFQNYVKKWSNNQLHTYIAYLRIIYYFSAKFYYIFPTVTANKQFLIVIIATYLVNIWFPFNHYY